MDAHPKTVAGLISHVEDRIDNAFVRELVADMIKEYVGDHVLAPRQATTLMVQEATHPGTHLFPIGPEVVYSNMVEAYLKSGPQKELF